MKRAHLQQAIRAMPGISGAVAPQLAAGCRELFSAELAGAVDRVFITGCGDSHHAGVAAALAFRQFSGLQTVTAMPAMGFARYEATYLPPPGDGLSLVIGISISGEVSRTAEALELAALAGAKTLAITVNPGGALAQAAELTLPLNLQPVTGIPDDVILPGAGSYIVSLLALYQIALRLGLLRGRLTEATWLEHQGELVEIADSMNQTIAACDDPAVDLVSAWADAGHFVYCGSGPNFGTALFSAAKLLEASGDVANAQDMEEWAHLDYFGRDPATPTLLISAADRDGDRASEIAVAARAIGRRLAIISPAGSALSTACELPERLSYAGHPRECYSPLVSCLPGLLIAAHRSTLLDEPYFRGFGGGRSVEGGGGISRIRTSHRVHQLRP
jgi:glucosamine--fructose-6-phosphate aminotransferase (isomerizing)